MTNQKLRVGIIGMGMYAATYHVPSLRATGRAEIVAAYRSAAERQIVKVENITGE